MYAHDGSAAYADLRCARAIVAVVIVAAASCGTPETPTEPGRSDFVEEAGGGWIEGNIDLALYSSEFGPKLYVWYLDDPRTSELSPIKRPPSTTSEDDLNAEEALDFRGGSGGVIVEGIVRRADVIAPRESDDSFIRRSADPHREKCIDQPVGHRLLRRARL